ncbi:hypothetical protein JXB11_01160 [Candidatus Woesearchaeota archaeon]|nr:hypothetical protein [Candidatus Woesearchaeota archaeon]
MRQKNASMFVPIVTIAFAILAISAVALLAMKSDKEMDPPLGSYQFALFEKYQQAENALLYLDTSAKYAMMDTAFKLANNSGFLDQGCGIFAGYKSWGYYNPATERYGCLAHYSTIDSFLHIPFFYMFEPILNNTYLIKYNYSQEHIEDVNLSKIVDYERFPDTDFIGEDGFTRLRARQVEPAINIASKDYDEDEPGFEYKILPSFSQVIPHNIPANFSHIMQRAPSIYPQLRRDVDLYDPVTDMVWHSGGCVVDAAERFYRFVEDFIDCQQRDQTGQPDDWGYTKCQCNTYDLSQIPNGYRFIVRQQGGATSFTLEEDQDPDPIAVDWVPLLTLWSEPNSLIYAYRYSCGLTNPPVGSRQGKGFADCDGPTARQCVNDLSSDINNCQYCGRDLTGTPWYCSGGREWCSTSGCPEGDIVGCTYAQCIWNPPGCIPYEGGCVGEGEDEYCWEAGCWPYDGWWDPCPSSDYCMHGTCTYSGCVHPDNTPVDQGTPTPYPLPADQYPTYSYDYMVFVGGGDIVINNNLCSNVAFDYCHPNGNMVQFVKVNGNVGFLEVRSEGIDTTVATSSVNALQPWPQCGAKETYRICVETMDSYLHYGETYDTLELRDSPPSPALQEGPIRYRFAAKFLP